MNEGEQQILIEAIEVEDCTPSVAQALKMKSMREGGTLNEDAVFAIMSEQKANRNESFGIKTGAVAKREKIR